MEPQPHLAGIPHESAVRLQPLLVRLLQGIVFFEDTKTWQQLLNHEAQVRRYFQCLGLQLYLSHDDGFAFLKSVRQEEDTDTMGDAAKPGKDQNAGAGNRDWSDSKSDIKSLVRKIPLSYDVSLLCVLLREALEQFDTSTRDDHRLILKATDLYDMLKIFYPDTQDLAKQQRRFDTIISKLEDLLFLKKLEGQTSAYEVRRVIKAFIDGDVIQRMKQVLIQGRNHKQDVGEEP